VRYPDIGSYRNVFSKIIEIRKNEHGSLAAVGSNFNPQSISSELKRQDVRVVIALGRNGLKAASALDRDIGVVAGGVLSVQENDVRSGTILSLAPDPALLFARLKALSPKTQRVHVVYEPRQNTWLLKLAKEAARLQGIELLAQEASDLKAAAAVYQGIFSSADPRRDALWLPRFTRSSRSSCHWCCRNPGPRECLFSRVTFHVKRGVLFAPTPTTSVRPSGQFGLGGAARPAGRYSRCASADRVQPGRPATLACPCEHAAEFRSDLPEQ
jgi:putative ABC transport system substrate-binding protein